jgi:hypothetical protein
MFGRRAGKESYENCANKPLKLGAFLPIEPQILNSKIAIF